MSYLENIGKKYVIQLSIVLYYTQLLKAIAKDYRRPRRLFAGPAKEKEKAEVYKL